MSQADRREQQSLLDKRRAFAVRMRAEDLRSRVRCRVIDECEARVEATVRELDTIVPRVMQQVWPVASMPAPFPVTLAPVPRSLTANLMEVGAIVALGLAERIDRHRRKS